MLFSMPGMGIDHGMGKEKNDGCDVNVFFLESKVAKNSGKPLLNIFELGKKSNNDLRKDRFF